MATRVYKKGPQSLADVIKEVEKLQAAQQLTSTLLPSSSVNTMSSDEDKCYQCQESGHMAHYCPHIRCFDCAMAMAMSQQISHTKCHHQACQQDTDITILTQDDVIDPHLRITIKIGTMTMTIETGIGLAGPDPMHAAIDTGVTVAVTHKEVTLGPITEPHALQYIMS